MLDVHGTERDFSESPQASLLEEEGSCRSQQVFVAPLQDDFAYQRPKNQTSPKTRTRKSTTQLCCRFPDQKNPPAARTLPAKEDGTADEATPGAIEAAPSTSAVHSANGSNGATNGRDIELSNGGDVELGELPARAKSPVKSSGLAFLPITLSFHDMVYEVTVMF